MRGREEERAKVEEGGTCLVSDMTTRNFFLLLQGREHDRQSQGCQLQGSILSASLPIYDQVWLGCLLLNVRSLGGQDVQQDQEQDIDVTEQFVPAILCGQSHSFSSILSSVFHEEGAKGKQKVSECASDK